MAALDRRRPPETPASVNPIPSSSPAFGTPIHPIRFPANSSTTTAFNPPAPKPASTILPVLLPPATLRPIAFRTFTKKHNLTLTSTALQSLASFVGKNCGSGWREDGLAELVLEEVAKSWKKSSADVIVDGTSEQLRTLLRTLEACMTGGRIAQGKSALSRQASFAFEGQTESTDVRPSLKTQESFGLSNLEVDDDEEDASKDLRSWLKVIGAFEQPRMIYNATKKHFEKSSTTPTIFPRPSHKTELFRQRYHLIHQRLLRNESFQAPTVSRQKSNLSMQQAFKITSIANLLGRSGSGHLILGMLTISPAGTLTINDLTGSICLDLEQAVPIDQQESWLVPGMIVLVDGVYEEEFNSSGSGLGSMGGIGGTISGRLIGFQIGAPKCEPRATTLGIAEGVDVSIGGGFGWTDFLGVGSERALGARMRRMEQRLLAEDSAHHDTGKMIIIGEVNLDNSRTLEVMRKIFMTYDSGSAMDIPMAFILMGNFVQYAAMAGGASGGSIEYKEYFDALAALVSDFPSLLQSSTFIFVPGDNDPWPSAFSAGAATPLPRNEVPELFTSRIKRAFASANAETRNSKRPPGEAVWTSNPSRISIFGPAHEVVLFRDDISGRFRRNAIRLKSTQVSGAEVEATGAKMSDASTAESTDAEMSGALPVEPSINQPDQDPVEMDVEQSPPELSHYQTESPAENPIIIDAPLQQARRLTKTILDQSHLSPFPLNIRPVQWDYASTLHLYPLPSTLVLCDAETLAFTCTYQGVHVINPGRCVADAGGGKNGLGVWIEYDVKTRRGAVREARL